MFTYKTPTRPERVTRTIRGAVATACFLAAAAAQASSHREAPFITEQPKVDATDFYMFRSYEPGREGYVTLIANYVPLQDPYGGPNYFALDPQALYEIHVDNDGDGAENVTFQFRFKLTRRDIALDVGGRPVAIPLVQAGQITSVRPPTQNSYETFTVDMVTGPRRGPDVRRLTDAATGATVFNKPIDNIGTKTLPNYAAYAAKFVRDVNIPGCGAGRLLRGQRKDPFAVNLGETFDLVNIKFPATEFKRERRTLGTRQSCGCECHESRARGPRKLPGTQRRPGHRRLDDGQSAPGPHPDTGQGDTGAQRAVSIETGPWVQVSRLGMPLVNEVVIGLKDKDRFNGSSPAHGRTVRNVRDQSGTARARRSALRLRRRQGADTLSANRSGGGFPDRSARPQTGRSTSYAGGDAAVEHEHTGGGAASQNRLGVLGGDHGRISERAVARVTTW
jgi:hypothetical protein